MAFMRTRRQMGVVVLRERFLFLEGFLYDLQGYRSLGGHPGKQLGQISFPRRLTTPLTAAQVPRALPRAFFHQQCMVDLRLDRRLLMHVPCLKIHRNKEATGDPGRAGSCQF